MRPNRHFGRTGAFDHAHEGSALTLICSRTRVSLWEATRQKQQQGETSAERISGSPRFWRGLPEAELCRNVGANGENHHFEGGHSMNFSARGVCAFGARLRTLLGTTSLIALSSAIAAHAQQVAQAQMAQAEELP